MARDPLKQAEAKKRHYLANQEAVKAPAVDWKRRQRKLCAGYVQDLKEAAACTDCGVSYPYYVMQFDHLGEDKEHNIADLVSSGVSLERLRAEISKCEIVCANCHAERTFRRSSDRKI